MSTFAAAADTYRPTYAARNAWIESPLFDLIFFVFAPLLTVPILLGVYWQIPWLANGGGITLAFAHYFSSIAFYFWDDSREYHRARWVAFFAGPVAIAGIFALMIAYDVPYAIQFVLFFWNTFHVARQNCGILSVYRHRAGVTDVLQKNAANTAILSVSTFLALWNIETHTEVAALFGNVSRHFSTIVLASAGAVAAIALIQLGFVLGKRFGGEKPIGLAEGIFLATSVAFFWPYLVIRSSQLATFVMLLPHYVQYIALVWLLHRRRFGSSESAGVPSWLRYMSSSLGILAATLFSVGFTFYALHRVAAHFHQPFYFERLYLLIAFEHFYIDGLVWSFKRRHVRDTIAPYLLRKPMVATA